VEAEDEGRFVVVVIVFLSLGPRVFVSGLIPGEKDRGGINSGRSSYAVPITFLVLFGLAGTETARSLSAFLPTRSA